MYEIFTLISFILVSVGVSHLWSFSEIFRPVRNLVARIPYIRKPLICPECSSFWIGLFVSFFINPFNVFLGYIFCGVISYIICVYLYKNNFFKD